MVGKVGAVEYARACGDVRTHGVSRTSSNATSTYLVPPARVPLKPIMHSYAELRNHFESPASEGELQDEPMAQAKHHTPP